MTKLLEIALRIKDLGEEVRKNLGCGFEEAIYQNALAIELRANQIDYLKEVNIEIFYKNMSVGTDRPDFVLSKVGDYVDPVILELKTTDRVTIDNRIQLLSYCKSVLKNNNPILAGCSGGILLAFPKGDIGDSAGVKIYTIDRTFQVLKDDQEEEDRASKLDKERQKQLKEQVKKGEKKARRKLTGFDKG
jgi:GxxExxY protein